MQQTASTLPRPYRPLVGRKETARLVHELTGFFSRSLMDTLHLIPVSAPLALEADTGINDDLNGVERPVRFGAPAFGRRQFEVPQSLAKWKRIQLAELDLEPGEGVLAELSALRPDETPGALHSIHVDQWDWELTLREEDRTLTFLKETVRKIYSVLRATERLAQERDERLRPCLPEKVTFLHTEELQERFPHLPPAERETEVAREHGAVFLIGVGAPLADGSPHDGRAPDYDDWITPNGRGRGLNGDLIVWHPVLERGYELSSMGIRVGRESLLAQLEARGCSEWVRREFHQRLLRGELPPSIGGGIGRSRTCAFLLRKAHIGEVQPAPWPDAERADCLKRGIRLL